MVSVVLIVDRHEVFRNGLRQLIESTIPQSQVIEAVEIGNVDVGIHLDLVLIDSEGLTPSADVVLGSIIKRNPQARCAMLSTSNVRATVLACLSAGFHGFVHKLQSERELVEAIKDLLTGRIFIPPWVAEGDETRSQPSETQADTSKLTPRQREILPLLAVGMSSKQIAAHLRISVGTTKIHTAALLKALGARNRAEAASMAGTVDRSASAGRLKTQLANGFAVRQPSTRDMPAPSNGPGHGPRSRRIDRIGGASVSGRRARMVPPER